MRTRFAPSPTGPLHLGHAYSAILTHDFALANGGEFLLRIEDIDQTRARPKWETQIYDDLEWLGLWWPKPVMRQSTRYKAYTETLDKLWHRDRLYPCQCRRRDIAAAANAPQEGDAPRTGPDGIIYPGTCRITHASLTGARPTAQILRLNMAFAMQWCGDSHITGDLFHFTEIGHGPKGETGTVSFTQDDMVQSVGDVVLSRQGMIAAYHLAVVLDDAAQGTTHVIRGQDLFEATKIHVVLQRLLGLPTPIYYHHPLIRDDSGKRLAKRDDARAIAKFRTEGATPDDIRRMVGL